jgi:hypothetical protein
MTVPVLTTRALNRATLARQMLLERSDMSIPETAKFLGGLQAQQSNDPYIALWSRLNGFRHEDLTALIVERTLNRATTMRGTLHLHTADDLLGYRALVQPFLTAQWKSNFLKRFGSEDRQAVVRAGRRLLDKAPMTAGALNKKLKEKFPSAEPIALSSLLALTETLVQIPPTRIWGTGSAPVLTRVENWLPPPYERPLSRENLVRRYLRAFGPASVNDMQIWCRLTRLGAEFETIKDELVVFKDEAGRTLYDFPDAPRPDQDTPAPVRFLPLYDNVYLGYDDRRRMLNEETVQLMSMFQSFKPAVLVDGTISAGWTITSKKGAATLEIELYRKMSRREMNELEAEGRRFIDFMDPGAESRAVAFTSKA